MRHVPALPLLILLAACGPWPDVPGPTAQSRDDSWPALMPLSDVIGAPADGEAGEAEADRLVARADALRRRAALLRMPADDSDAFEALRARLAR